MSGLRRHNDLHNKHKNKFFHITRTFLGNRLIGEAAARQPKTMSTVKEVTINEADESTIL